MKYIILSIFCLFMGLTHSQVISSEWSNAPFSDLGIAENNGRYDKIMEAEVLYYGFYGPYSFYFIADGIIIGQKEKLTPEESWERHEKQEKREIVLPITFNYFKIKWQNSNPDVTLVPSDKNNHTLNFQDQYNTEKTLKSATYKNLVYRNIYDNIDLAFILPEEGGLKYSFTLHPGSNPKNIIMAFEAATATLDESGQMTILSEIDAYRDHEPSAWYDSSETSISVVYGQADDGSMRFELSDYDASKTVVIDPWLVPALPFIDRQQAYDIGMDFDGNVSILGQYGNQVAHYDNTGLLEWVWTFPGELNEFYGDIDVNQYSGHTYCMYMGLFLGIQDIWRLDLDGVVSEAIYLDPSDDDPGELWRMSYNAVTDQLVIGAGGLPRASHLCVVDGDLTSNNRYAPLTPMPPNLTDATFLEVDPCGEYIYFLCSGDAGIDGGITELYDDVLYKVQQADPTIILWESATFHHYEEISCIGYLGREVETGEGPDWYSPNGHNGIAVSYDVYTYDGDTLNRWDKSTGDFLGAVSVTPLDFTIYGDLAFCGGIDTDVCGNVYVGTEDSLIKYSRELEYLEAIALPDTCFDLRIAKERMSTCGADFVESYDFLDLVDYSMSSTPQPCGECTGTASIDETSTICPELTFASVLWSPGGQTTTTATDLCVGWYTATITWSNGLCDSIVRIDSVEVVLGAPGELIKDITLQSCSDDCDGEVEISVTGGFPPFVFDLEGDINATGIYTDLCPGVYDLLVTDDDGCVFIDSVVIIEVDSLIVSEIITDEACEGACNGTITLTPEAGVAPFVFSLDGAEGASGYFEDLCVGTYTITVVDSNGCSYENTVTISVGESLGLDTIVANNPTCYGFADGSATVATAIGVEPITYIWVPENPVEGATYNSMTAGTYEVYAMDAAGCVDTLIFELLQPDSVYVDLNIINPICFGDPTGIAVVDSVYNAQGNLDNITYIWSPDPANVTGVGADSSYQLSAGNYTLTVNDDLGCSSVITFTISQPDELVFSEFGYDPTFCRLFENQSGNGVVYAAATGGTSGYEYDWINLETLETSENSTWGGLDPGLYRIIITDANGCTLMETVQLDSVNPIAAFTVDSDQLNEDCEGTELVIANFINESQYFANPNNPVADTTFFWNLNHPNANWMISHDYFEVIDTSYVGEAIYEVCLVARNKNGCSDTTCKNIIVHVQPEFVAPNIFTPSGNGINDEFTFEFSTLGIETFHCTIVNRWGIAVAELNSVTDGWDGTDRNGDDCTNGVYFYTYQAVSTNSTVFNGQGNVQLVRE
ncbi:MAG: gliding motility-associated-like protein [Crocinitomix sp.]|jgi:gliding motility-associated-like protein